MGLRLTMFLWSWWKLTRIPASEMTLIFHGQS